MGKEASLRIFEVYWKSIQCIQIFHIYQNLSQPVQPSVCDLLLFLFSTLVAMDFNSIRGLIDCYLI